MTAQVQPVIHYQQPYGTSAAQILGYLQPITPQEVAQRHLPVTGFSGVDLVGQAGLEEQYDRQLRGTAGKQVLRVNAAGEVTSVRQQTPAVPGDTLVTSINAQLQQDTQTRAGAGHQPRAGRGQHGRDHGRGGGDDHHGAGWSRWPATPPTTPASGPAASPPGSSVTCSGPRTASRS